MINPATEFAGFLRASLIEPVPRDHTESDAAFRRRRRVAIITLAAGALVLGWALRLDPGDPLFYVGTFASTTEAAAVTTALAVATTLGDLLSEAEVAEIEAALDDLDTLLDEVDRDLDGLPDP